MSRPRWTRRRRRGSRRGFSLFEIKIAVVLIGVVATLVVSGSVKARKLSQGRCILDECRQMDAAIDQWALETGQKAGSTIDIASAERYLRAAWSTVDPLGNPYHVTVVGRTQISINSASKASLAGVGIDWGAY
jgi:prepilin-type N-terminal cleavage/methylation domain-containing protein